MKQLAGITAIAAGILLAIVPRYVLPACEFGGFSRMNCSDTMEAGFISAALLVLIGILILFVKSPVITMSGTVLVLALSIWSALVPVIFGYCRSPRMPCNYGMVPGIVFISFLSALVAAVVAVVLFVRLGKKGNA